MIDVVATRVTALWEDGCPQPPHYGQTVTHSQKSPSDTWSIPAVYAFAPFNALGLPRLAATLALAAHSEGPPKSREIGLRNELFKMGLFTQFWPTTVLPQSCNIRFVLP